MYLIKREMGCSSADLVRWLPQALNDLYPHTSLQIDGRDLQSVSDPFLQISGITRPERKIALLSIPVLDLSLSFAPSFPQERLNDVLRRFDLYTRRGGG
jgi:hypothetical protein